MGGDAAMPDGKTRVDNGRCGTESKRLKQKGIEKRTEDIPSEPICSKAPHKQHQVLDPGPTCEGP